ncbi:Glycine--tRNA ligase beta subunit [Candidatus Desulfarcum epimagneticum]|uniref:Glycine--tRNA ligase beta subunit n=1 Tax=uncultured Desulfobacteraceae bacterium TaxID=218296 RepID=A0A484HIA6_9BACT|nr:Glycine--tRNA ligase beta subunit [uncultured Desulfobacteraceae bacterium]
MKTLLLEIGTEEIPAGYIQPALDALVSGLKGKLENAGIDFGAARSFGTPRRLCVEIKDVSEKQRPVVTEILGPPEKAAFDENNAPTIAAEKFAERAGVPVSRLKRVETPKGRRIMAVQKKPGLAAQAVLKDILPQAISSIPFPKTMRWGDFSMRFARPVHSILALFGRQVISFSMENIKSGRICRGHAFMSPGKIKIDSPEEYEKRLEEAFVIVDPAVRKAKIAEKVSEAAREKGGRALEDAALLDIVANLVEYPAVSAGAFDADFLALPREVLITAMREHQKYFAVVDEKGGLMPFFIAVNNTPAKDMDLVSKGHERVLRARLADARFFYENDVAEPSSRRVEKLKKVLFQADLGSMHEKTLRVQKLCRFICGRVRPGDRDFEAHAERAAFLCNADLVSKVVVEFPKLQGVMGRALTQVENEPPEVSTAIEERYRPTRSGGPLPESEAGAVLSVADKIDSICGCFSVGFVPTGARDPYALRRQGIGIVRMMRERGFSFDLTDLIKESLGHFTDHLTGGDIDQTAADIERFFKTRMENLLEDEGVSKDVVQAVTGVSTDHIPGVWERAGALEAIKRKPDFEPLAVAFKRVVNIVKKADPDSFRADGPDPGLFEDDCEGALLDAFQKTSEKIQEKTARGRYGEALLDAASLRKEVDAYFDGVMVMDPNPEIRANRLSLLKKLGDMFNIFGDFSKLSA